MAVQVVCSHCKNRVMIPDSLRDKGLNCPVCGQPMAPGRTTPPPLGAGSLLDMRESDLVASRSAPAVGPSAQWHRRRTPPTALWAVMGGLSLLLIMILIAVMLKNGCESKARRGQPNPTVATEKQRG